MSLVSVATVNKYVRLRGRPYIHTCRSYVHTPTDIPRTSHLYRISQRASHADTLYVVPQNVRFPALDADEPL